MAAKVEEPEDTSPKPKKQQDPLVGLMLNSEVIKLTSTIMAKLELIKYDETRRGVFRTTWIKNLFSTCVKRLSPESMGNFNIDDWYYSIVTNGESRSDTRFRPSLIVQDVDTNWLLPLLELEMKAPGFVMLLHNTMELEDSTHDLMAERSKKIEQYDFLGVGQRNAAIPMLQGPASSHKLLGDGRSSKR